MEGERLQLRLLLVRVKGHRPVAQRQSDKAPAGELVSEIAVWRPLAPPDAGRGVEEDHQHGRERALAIRNEQVRVIRREARGDFETNAMLREVVAPLLVQVFDLRFLHQRRPRTHDRVPSLQDFLPSLRPVNGVLNGPAIGECQWRPVFPQVAGQFGGGPEKRR
jgi:hypothetical protein